MVAAENLPEDIICNILNWVRTSSNNFDLKLEDIALLAICSRWRAVAVPLIYRRAYLSQELFGTTFYVRSNIDLIQQNGFNTFVSEFAYRLIYSQHLRDDISRPSHKIEIYANGSPQVKRPGKSSDTKHLGHNKPLAVNKHLVTTAVAAELAQILPMVKRLYLKVDIGDYFFIHEAITNLFAGQISELHYSGKLQIIAQSPIVAPAIVTIRAHKRGQGDDFIILRPHRIKTLNLAVSFVDFDWKLFCGCDNTDTAVFDNLETLVLDYMGERASENYLSGEEKLRFPKITTLSISHFPFSTGSIQRMLHSGLRLLKLRGSLSRIAELAVLDLSSLDELSLNTEIPELTEEFISATNTLFARMGEISTVRFDVYADAVDLDLNRLYWLHLTHLTIYINMPFEDMVRAASRMPNLVSLTVHFIDFHGDSDAAHIYLNALRDNRTKPTTSKIELFYLYTMGLNSAKSFTVALQALKLVWPRLNSIKHSC